MLYNLTLVALNADEIEFLATCMEIMGIGMGDASKYVDSMPSVLFSGIDGPTAQKYKAQFEACGAVIEVSHAQDGSDAAQDTSAPEKKEEPKPAPTPEPEPAKAPVKESEPEPAEEPKKEARTIPAIPIDEPEPEPEPEPLPAPTPVEMPSQSVFQINDPAAQTATEENIEEPKYDFYGSCPKCGSAFVTVKKVAGLFGGTKVKCVCSACKHKF